MENHTPRIPRAQWAAHPRFPQQTLLLGSHDNFRILAKQVAVLAEEEPRRAERLFRRWMYAMRSHEAYEERKLYPFLSRRWDVSMSPLAEGHEALAVRKADVFDAFGGVLDREGGGAERRALRRTLTAFKDTLEAHLELEEDTVIPLLLELSPSEFADYYHS